MLGIQNISRGSAHIMREYYLDEYKKKNEINVSTNAPLVRYRPHISSIYSFLRESKDNLSKFNAVTQLR